MATLNTRIVLRNDTAERWANSTVVLKMGEIGVENDTGYFKIGDGLQLWNALPYANKFESTPTAAHYDVVPAAEQSDLEAIAAKLAEQGAEAKLDDVAIVRREIANGKYSHTAYVYDGSKWAAMDGNYNAENVYFDEDIMITTAVGNISLSNGSANIPAAGKNIKQVFEAIWTKENLKPKVTDPSISLTVQNAEGLSAVEGEVGTSFNAPTAAVTATGFGKFEFGSQDKDGNFYAANASSDVVFSELRVGQAATAAALDETNSATAINVAANSSTKYQTWGGKAGIFTDTEQTQIFSASAQHTGSERKGVSNLGNLVNSTGTALATDFASAGKGIAANAGSTMTINGKGKFTATGYRKMFAGGSKAEITNSEVIRGLKASARAEAVDSTKPFEFEAANGDTKVMFAYPKDAFADKTPKFEMKTMSWGAFNGFESSEVSVADARGAQEDGSLYGPMTYTVWTAVSNFVAETTPFRVYFE